jgi:hypothetical protein
MQLCWCKAVEPRVSCHPDRGATVQAESMSTSFLPQNNTFSGSAESLQKFDEWLESLLRADAHRFWEQLTSAQTQQSLDTYFRFARCAFGSRCLLILRCSGSPCDDVHAGFVRPKASCTCTCQGTSSVHDDLTGMWCEATQHLDEQPVSRQFQFARSHVGAQCAGMWTRCSTQCTPTMCGMQAALRCVASWQQLRRVLHSEPPAH